MQKLMICPGACPFRALYTGGTFERHSLWDTASANHLEADA